MNCFHNEKAWNEFTGPVDLAATAVHRFIVDRAAARWPSSPEVACATATGHNSLPRELLEEGEVEGNLTAGTDDGGAAWCGRATTASNGDHSSSTGERLERGEDGISAGM
jgi:hypothetical protein